MYDDIADIWMDIHFQFPGVISSSTITDRITKNGGERDATLQPLICFRFLPLHHLHCFMVDIHAGQRLSELKKVLRRSGSKN